MLINSIIARRAYRRERSVAIHKLLIFRSFRMQSAIQAELINAAAERLNVSPVSTCAQGGCGRSGVMLLSALLIFLRFFPSELNLAHDCADVGGSLVGFHVAG